MRSANRMITSRRRRSTHKNGAVV